MNRRDLLKAMFVLMHRQPAAGAVSTLIGTGTAGYSDQQVNNPYGLAIGPDGALYFCDLDNQRIRRLDVATHRTATIAGSGVRAYAGDGAPAGEASLNMPHEIQFSRGCGVTRVRGFGGLPRRSAKREGGFATKHEDGLMTAYSVQLEQRASIPLAVIRRPARASELARAVPA